MLRLIFFRWACWLLLVVIGSSTYRLKAQNPAQPADPLYATQLEQITESLGDVQPEDDHNAQSLDHYLRTPLNLNAADEAALSEFFFLSPLQIRQLLDYRSLLGELLSIYELQAVPGWDPAIIGKIRPYVVVQQTAGMLEQFRTRLKGGTHQLLARVSQALQPSEGFRADPLTGEPAYKGSPQRLFLRYGYQYKHLLQYGFAAEKDAGEELFRGSQRKGFDFYTAHLFIRDLGFVHTLALGDFTVNMGQGLMHWQGLAFRKSAEITAVKRQGLLLRPYRSAGEFNFHRGVGIRLGRQRTSITAFASLRHLDANRESDTLLETERFWVTSFQQSGLHRTPSELADKGVQRQWTFGGNLSRSFRQGHVGLNAVRYVFGTPVQSNPAPYNRYAFSGKDWSNYSFDFSYTRRNVHVFGELAADAGFHAAGIAGCVLSVDAAADLCFLYRNIAPQYRALYANAFTENSSRSNERGIYSGVSIRPASGWRIDAYVDLYRFPWLRYQASAPSSGVDYLAQMTYRPDKKLELVLRYRTETKQENRPEFYVDGSTAPGPVTRQGLRWHMQYRLSASLTLRQRLELVWFNRRGLNPQDGFLSFMDFIYKPMQLPISGNIRLQYFESDGYDSRIYAYENDVLFNYSIPVYYNKGYRFYLNVNGDLSRKMSFWLRVATTRNTGNQGSGARLNDPDGSWKSDLSFQVRYLF